MDSYQMNSVFRTIMTTALQYSCLEGTINMRGSDLAISTKPFLPIYRNKIS